VIIALRLIVSIVTSTSAPAVTQSLAPWVRDLIERIAMFNDWATCGEQPKVFWISAFSFPTGFLTAVLQIASRTNSVPIDHIDWEFPIMNVSEENIKETPADGVYIKGLFIEGAGCVCASARNRLRPRPQFQSSSFFALQSR
jgi:hypothetical protein